MQHHAIVSPSSPQSARDQRRTVAVSTSPCSSQSTRIGSCQHTDGFHSVGDSPAVDRGEVQRAPGATGEARPVQEDARAVDDSRRCARSSTKMSFASRWSACRVVLNTCARQRRRQRARSSSPRPRPPARHRPSSTPAATPLPRDQGFPCTHAPKDKSTSTRGSRGPNTPNRRPVQNLHELVTRARVTRRSSVSARLRSGAKSMTTLPGSRPWARNRHLGQSAP